MRISNAPKLKDMNMNYYSQYDPGIPLSRGILGYFHNMYGNETPWLQTPAYSYTFDILMKTKYGERHLNSLGQMMMRTVDHDAEAQQGFVDGCDILWHMHQEEWTKLWNAYIAEYNPIWNVDAEESTTETRDLEDNHTGTDTMGQTGTITNAKSGTDTVAMTGTDANAKTGTDTTAMTGTDENAKTGYDTVTSTGTDTNAKTGTDTVATTGTDTNAKTGHDTVAMTGTDANAKTGTDTLAKTGTSELEKTGSERTHTSYTTDNDYDIDIDGSETGTDTMTKSGSESNVHSGSVANSGTETVAHKIFGFNATTGQDSDSETRTPNLTTTFNNETNTLTYNSRQDQETKNLANTHDEHRDEVKDEDTDATLSFTNRSDTETLNLQDRTTYASTETETKNLQDQTTYASTTTETKNLQDETTYASTNTETKNLTDRTTFNSTETETKNLQDQTIYATTETETRNLQDQTTYASSNTETFAKTDTNTKALKDTQEGTITTIYERHGNVGVTMTQQMLEADRDYWLSATSLFYENVLKDIVTDICYKIQVDEYI